MPLGSPAVNRVWPCAADWGPQVPGLGRRQWRGGRASGPRSRRALDGPGARAPASPGPPTSLDLASGVLRPSYRKRERSPRGTPGRLRGRPLTPRTRIRHPVPRRLRAGEPEQLSPPWRPPSRPRSVASKEGARNAAPLWGTRKLGRKKTLRSRSHSRALFAALSPEPRTGGAPGARGASKGAGPSEPQRQPAPAPAPEVARSLSLPRPARAQRRAYSLTRAHCHAHSGTHPTRAHRHSQADTRTHGGWPTAALAVCGAGMVQIGHPREGSAAQAGGPLSLSFRLRILLNLVSWDSYSHSSVREYGEDALSKNRNTDF